MCEVDGLLQVYARRADPRFTPCLVVLVSCTLPMSRDLLSVQPV